MNAEQIIKEKTENLIKRRNELLRDCVGTADISSEATEHEMVLIEIELKNRNVGQCWTEDKSDENTVPDRKYPASSNEPQTATSGLDLRSAGYGTITAPENKKEIIFS